MFFAYNPPAKSLAGAFFAMLSITAYTYVNVKEQAASEATDAPIVHKVKKIDIMLPASVGDCSSNNSTTPVEMRTIGGSNSVKQSADDRNVKQADV